MSYFGGLKYSVDLWLRDHRVRGGFFAVTAAKTFEEGTVSHMNLAGLGERDIKKGQFASSPFIAQTTTS